MSKVVEQTVNVAKRCQGIAFKHRAPRAIKCIVDQVAKSLNDQEISKYKVTEQLNLYMWQQGIRNPPKKVRVQTTIQELDNEKIAIIDVLPVDSFKGLLRNEKQE